MYILIYPRGSNEAIRGTAPPQQAGEDQRAHTHNAFLLARRDEGGSPLCRRHGLGHEPVEIATVDALDGEHQDRRRGVGMHLRSNANQINVLGGGATMCLQPYQRRLLLVAALWWP